MVKSKKSKTEVKIETFPQVFRERFGILIERIDYHQLRVEDLKAELKKEREALAAAQAELVAIARKAAEGLPLFEQASQTDRRTGPSSETARNGG